MRAVGVRELKDGATELLRQVRERGETIALSHRGQVFARIVPVQEAEGAARSFDEWETAAKALADGISQRWPAGVSAVDAVREQRRDP
jgi:antitoxin (DNA-binding transcriptional repressor) of toxin-antitoxin stability system